jgi:hypothetical protein
VVKGLVTSDVLLINPLPDENLYSRGRSSGSSVQAMADKVNRVKDCSPVLGKTSHFPPLGGVSTTKGAESKMKRSSVPGV